MDNNSLRLFIHLADTLHYGKTSKACNVSPSTLSRTIQRLEDNLGRQLFERDNRSVNLTETGIAFRNYAREALSRWQTFQNSLDRQAAVLRGEISMYCTITASYGVLPDILVRFREAYPEIHISLITGDSAGAIQNVIDGNADFAVAALPDRLPDKLSFKPITEISLRFVAPMLAWPYADAIAQDALPWDRIPMVVARKGMARKRIDAWFASQKIKPNIHAQVTGNESILAMVSLGFGIGVVPQLVLDKNMLNQDVQVMDTQPSLQSYAVGICAQKRRLSNPLVKAFWDIIEK
ncbi:MAG: HTH-type transcriptional activator IlvY [Deltaproteobacteria bacterium]|nr:HTH-type transcriptional activator IlvY [Deltaproteobacteria bacterium]